jgi:O-acetyl-ADP-ribose deacetylase (regulator of RNase III)
VPHPASVLGLNGYREQVGLDVPFRPPSASGRDRTALLRTVLAELVREGTAIQAAADPADLRAEDPARAWRLLQALLTIRPPGPFPPDATRALDELLHAQRSAKRTVSAADLPRVASRVALWQGDLTGLEADAIVNAANDRLLGCFIPYHRCIDNAFHAAAGPRLRADCSDIMRLQGLPAEPTGTAKATRAYHLPARFVLHTVGPIVRGRLTEHHQESLASCYSACLDLAAELRGVRTVAFCAIATGVFGYPFQAAARIAVRTVDRWLGEHPDGPELVVFNAFTQPDLITYQSVLAGYSWEHAA